jgi:hypothetical protein
MKKGITTDIDWKYIGSCLAQESDIEQIDFIKSFIKECQSWGTRFQVEQQLACVNMKLTDEEKDVLSMLSYRDTP